MRVLKWFPTWNIFFKEITMWITFLKNCKVNWQKNVIVWIFHNIGDCFKHFYSLIRSNNILFYFKYRPIKVCLHVTFLHLSVIGGSLESPYLGGCFWLFPPKFWEVARIYKLTFFLKRNAAWVMLTMQDGWDTQKLSNFPRTSAPYEIPGETFTTEYLPLLRFSIVPMVMAWITDRMDDTHFSPVFWWQ